MSQVSVYLPGILLAYSVFFVAIVSPGPNILSVIGTSMGVNRKAGIALALGIAAGSFCWAMLTALGLSALLTAYAAALTAIKIGGGLYLLWLSYKSFRSAASAYDIEANALSGLTRGAFGYTIRGFTIQMTNPKAALAWIAIMALGLKQHAPLWVALSIVVGTSVLSVIIHWLYAVAFSTRVMVRLYSKGADGSKVCLAHFLALLASGCSPVVPNTAVSWRT